MKLPSLLLLPAVAGAWSFEALASDDGSRFQGLTYPHLSEDAGSVLFGAELDNGSLAVFSGAPASEQITPIISTSDTIPGHPGQRFVGGVDALVGSHEPVAAWAFHGRGNRIPGPDQRRFEGIYRSNSSQHPLHWQTVAETHSPMPSSGATFAVFSAPSITDAGEVIFGGWNDTTAPIWKGIYSREQNKPPTMLVDSSSLHPALHKPFTDIEGSLASFDGKTVAFFAAVEKHAGLFAVDTRTRQLRILADMSTSVPHGNSTNETFTAFSTPAMSADGNTVGFYATGSQGTEGVYVVGVDGVAHCVADTSMNVSVALPARSSSSSSSSNSRSVSVRLVGFSQPPSLDDRTQQAMFLANTMPPEYSGIYVGDAWGSKGVRPVVTLATAKAEGLGEIVYLGFHGSSLNGTKFAFYASGPNSSKVYLGTDDEEPPSTSRGKRLRGRAHMTQLAAER